MKDQASTHAFHQHFQQVTPERLYKLVMVAAGIYASAVQPPLQPGPCPIRILNLGGIANVHRARYDTGKKHDVLKLLKPTLRYMPQLEHLHLETSLDNPQDDMMIAEHEVDQVLVRRTQRERVSPTLLHVQKLLDRWCPHAVLHADASVRCTNVGRAHNDPNHQTGCVERILEALHAEPQRLVVHGLHCYHDSYHAFEGLDDMVRI